jgi:hypothetical protein
MSAVTPAPDEGSKPAMVNTTGGFPGIIVEEKSVLLSAILYLKCSP